jgi:hypothetical protein
VPSTLRYEKIWLFKRSKQAIVSEVCACEGKTSVGKSADVDVAEWMALL